MWCQAFSSFSAAGDTSTTVRQVNLCHVFPQQWSKIANSSVVCRSHISIFIKKETATNAAAPWHSGCICCYCHRENDEKTDPKTGSSCGNEQHSWLAWLCALICPSLRELRLQLPLDFFAGLYPQQPCPPVLAEHSFLPLQHPSAMVCAMYSKQEGCADSGCEYPSSLCFSSLLYC